MGIRKIKCAFNATHAELPAKGDFLAYLKTNSQLEACVFSILGSPRESQEFSRLRQFRRNGKNISLAEKRGIGTMAQENVRLRLEAADGSATKEYRIDDGKVEVRSLHSRSVYEPPESSWHQVTSQELGTHVERNTVVAQWLERRLGWRRLLQACVSQGPHEWTAAEDYVDRHAA